MKSVAFAKAPCPYTNLNSTCDIPAFLQNISNCVFCLFVLLQVLYMSIVLYAPSLALNAGNVCSCNVHYKVCTLIRRTNYLRRHLNRLFIY